MKKHWQFVPLAALVIAAACIAFARYVAETGRIHWIVQLFGVDFGITQLKAHARLYWFGEPHAIPLFGILYFAAFVAVCVSIIFTARHFRLR